MDTITHAVIGISVAALAGETVAIDNPIILGCMIGAIIPDCDIIMQLKGHRSFLKNHRGISHSIITFPIYASIITFVLSLFFPQIDFMKIFIFTLFGCLSHITLDIANTYGARILWPFFKKRITLNLLLVYDPIIAITGILIILNSVSNTISQLLIISIFVSYFMVRIFMKLFTIKALGNNFENKFKINQIRVLPSMIGFMKWHFIIKSEDMKIIGEYNMLKRSIRIIDEMENIPEDLFQIAINTPLAKFFKDFTPIFHVNCEKKEEGYTFNFIDLRYYMAKDFVHNATAVLNNNLDVVTSIFHPYNKTKNVEV